MRTLLFRLSILIGGGKNPVSPVVILICPRHDFRPRYLFITAQLRELARSHYPSFCGLFILCVLICRSFLYHLPLNTSSSPTTPERRAVGWGWGDTGPPGNLGFLRNVLMRRQAASPRFLLWAFWGHSLVRLPHQEGSYFREPQEK